MCAEQLRGGVEFLFSPDILSVVGVPLSIFPLFCFVFVFWPGGGGGGGLTVLFEADVRESMKLEMTGRRGGMRKGRGGRSLGSG